MTEIGRCANGGNVACVWAVALYAAFVLVVALVVVIVALRSGR